MVRVLTRGIGRLVVLYILGIESNYAYIWVKYISIIYKVMIR